MSEEMQKDLAEIKEMLKRERRITKEEIMREPNDAKRIQLISENADLFKGVQHG